MKRKYIALVIALALVSIVLGAMTYQRRIPSIGNVYAVGVDVYWDAACTQNVTLIDWGEIAPSTINNVTIYIKNTSTEDADLTLTTENWNPTNISSFLTLTWNYNGTFLHPNEARQTMLFLAVSDDTTSARSAFSFDIIITATIGTT